MTHAWLFTGPAGSGRSVAARAFAAALQCERDAARAAASAPAAARCAPAPTPTCTRSCPTGCRSRSPRCARSSAARRGGRRWAAGRSWSSRTPTGSPSRRPTRCSRRSRSRRRARCSCSASRPLHPGRRAGHDPLALPAGHAAHPAGRRGRRRARADGVDAAEAQWAAAVGQGHVGRSRRLAARRRRPRAPRGRCWRSRPRSPRCAPASTPPTTSSARPRPRRRRCPPSSTPARPRRCRSRSAPAAPARAPPATARGTVGAIRELEKRQKSRATRTQRDALDRALVDLAAFYRDVLLVQAGAAGRRRRIRTSPTTSALVAAGCRPAGRAAAPRRRARLPRGARAQRQAAHRRRGDDRRACACR